MKNITVFFFATLRERAGMKLTHLEIPADATVANLKVILGQKFLSLNGLVESSLVAINLEYAFDESQIPVGAEIALFPPVSGG